MPGEPLETRIFPPEAYAWGWWLVVAACVLAAVAVVWWLRHTLRSLRPRPTGPDDVAGLKAEALVRVDQVATEFAAGAISAVVAHQQLSATVRRFAGIATGGDADYQAAPELRRAATKDPRLEPVAGFVEWVAPAAFAGSLEPDVTTSVAKAREVIGGWA